MKKTLYTLLFIFIGTISSFSATTYYVATNGNDNNAGTLASPLATIAKAITKVVAGDTIYVRSGTYVTTARINITKAGTSTARYTLSAYKPDLIAAYPADGRPVLDFSSMAVNSSNQGFSLSGANYWNIYGLRIMGAGDNGMVIQTSSYSTVEFCSFFHSRDSGLQIRASSHHFLILNCDSYDNADLGTGTTTLGGNADGFAPKLDLGDSVIFRGCRAWRNSDDGWDGYLKAQEASVPDGMVTILENCWTWGNGYYWLDGSTTADQNGNGFKMGGSANKDQAHNFVVVKCLSLLNKAKGFDQNNNAGSMSLYNCTSYKNGDYDYGLNSSGVTYATGATTTLKNCISLGSKGTTFRSGTVQATNNFSTSTTSTNFTSFDTTGISAQRKVDGSLPTLGFMNLQTSPKSSLIDAGTKLTTISYYGVVGVPYIGAGADLGYAESNYVLPVSMVYFNAVLNNNSVLLSWQTATEINNKGWEIEKLNTTNVSPFTWQNIGFVGGINGNDLKNYNFTDNDVFPGNTYQYRLKQIDADGKMQYSNIVAVKTSTNPINELSVFPNPVKVNSIIQFSITTTEQVSIVLLNQQGQLVKTLLNETLAKGTYSRNINLTNIASGTYFVKMICGQQETVKSLLKVY